MPAGGNSFTQYLLNQRGQRQRLGFDQPLPPPPNVQMGSPEPPPGAGPPQGAPSPPSGPGGPPPGLSADAAGPPPQAPVNPDEMLTTMGLPPGMTPQVLDTAAMADLADDAWEQNFYRVNSRWPTSMEYQMQATAREITQQTGRAPSRTELLATVFQRVLLPPQEAPDFEEI